MGKTLMKSISQKVATREQIIEALGEWKAQFPAAFFCNGSLEEQAGASPADWLFHILALPWKVAFAAVPPPSLFAGYACFFSALFSIGCVCSFVKEMATLLGCCLNIPDDIT